MSVSFDGVKVGDRVRLTRTNGDLAELTVTGTLPLGIASEMNRFNYKDWDTVEVLSPPKPPLPTVPGIYVSKSAGSEVSGTFYYLADADGGDWVSDETGAWARTAEVPADLVRLVPEGEPSGLLEAAREALELVQPRTWSIESVNRAYRVLSDAIKAEEAQS